MVLVVGSEVNEGAPPPKHPAILDGAGAFSADGDSKHHPGRDVPIRRAHDPSHTRRW